MRQDIPGKHCKKCNGTIWYEDRINTGPRKGKTSFRCVNCVLFSNSDRAKQDRKRASQKKVHAKRKENGKAWASILMFNHGISTQDYMRLLASQNGVCAICGKPCRTGHRLSIDHDHKTGKIRGLLCGSCNLFVGQLEDTRLESGLAYLKRPETSLFSHFSSKKLPPRFDKRNRPAPPTT